MQLSEFSLEKRGPRSFDTWIYKEKIPSSIGSFSLEVYLDSGERPTSEMLENAQQLIDRFLIDEPYLIQKFYDNYVSVCNDPSWTDWLRDCDVPLGLSLEKLPEYIRDRILSVDDELEKTVSVTPAWDIEHGINYHLIDSNWELGL